MAIERPDLEQLLATAKCLHLNLTEQEAEEYLALMQANFDAYDVVDGYGDFLPETRYPRDAGYRPDTAENDLNAWYYKTTVVGANTGPLKGMTVALKDNIALAGVPMMNGSATLDGYIPDVDATVATRLLDAGATILGKATCEHFCLSGGSHTSDPAPVHNPWRHGYCSGGSSSGSAALVASGEVTLALGSDQGGSIRIPSAFCGTYGMKPTHGLVPYTGMMAIEATVDHVGPITANVKDNARALAVLAGADGLDPRQQNPQVGDYLANLSSGVKGLKIGVLAEGFTLPNQDVEVTKKVSAAIAQLEALGAEIVQVSVPEHKLAGALWSPIGCEGLTMQMMHGNGHGFSWKGLYNVSLLDSHAKWREHANELSPSLKICMLIGQYGLDKYDGRYYAMAQNLTRKAKAAYDDVFQTVDLLVMPTVPITAQPLPAANCSITESISKAFEMIGNTAPFDVTGHPAMSIPCGLADGLPVGLMLVGRHYDEATIYQAAAAYESSVNWQQC